jgi:benzoyl-CoA reductase/2-hydroxyglutaryl-CoA dehydratase subunit BcrC/BadD/HgdB
LDGLVRTIKENSVQGVILLNTKWCDPEAFEFVSIENKLKELSIPSLRIETTPDLSNSEQIHTRVGAFIEMLI